MKKYSPAEQALRIARNTFAEGGKTKSHPRATPSQASGWNVGPSVAQQPTGIGAVSRQLSDWGERTANDVGDIAKYTYNNPGKVADLAWQSTKDAANWAYNNPGEAGGKVVETVASGIPKFVPSGLWGPSGLLNPDTANGGEDTDALIARLKAKQAEQGQSDQTYQGYARGGPIALAKSVIKVGNNTYSPQEIRAVLQKIASMGINKDKVLAQITPREAAILKMHGGSGRINPRTGLPSFDDGGGGGDGGGDGGDGGDGGGGGNGGEGDSSGNDSGYGDPGADASIGQNDESQQDYSYNPADQYGPDYIGPGYSGANSDQGGIFSNNAMPSMSDVNANANFMSDNIAQTIADPYAQDQADAASAASWSAAHNAAVAAPSAPSAPAAPSAPSAPDIAPAVAISSTSFADPNSLTASNVAPSMSMAPASFEQDVAPAAASGPGSFGPGSLGLAASEIGQSPEDQSTIQGPGVYNDLGQPIGATAAAPDVASEQTGLFGAIGAPEHASSVVDAATLQDVTPAASYWGGQPAAAATTSSKTDDIPTWSLDPNAITDPADLHGVTLSPGAPQQTGQATTGIGSALASGLGTIGNAIGNAIGPSSANAAEAAPDEISALFNAAPVNNGPVVNTTNAPVLNALGSPGDQPESSTGVGALGQASNTAGGLGTGAVGTGAGVAPGVGTTGNAATEQGATTGSLMGQGIGTGASLSDMMFGPSNAEANTGPAQQFATTPLTGQQPGEGTGNFGVSGPTAGPSAMSASTSAAPSIGSMSLGAFGGGSGGSGSTANQDRAIEAAQIAARNAQRNNFSGINYDAKTLNAPIPTQRGLTQQTYADQLALARTIIGEHRGTDRNGQPDVEGQNALAQSAINRTIAQSGVGVQGGPAARGSVAGQVTARNQFSWMTNAGDPSHANRNAVASAERNNSAAWQQAMAQAADVIGGQAANQIGPSTMYHTPASHPGWSDTLPVYGQVGPHVFHTNPAAVARIDQARNANPLSLFDANNVPQRAYGGIIGAAIKTAKKATK